MYKEKIAELNDVDLILDVKLDIIFKSEEIISLEKNEMEKIVNYCEEDIRENLNTYRLIYDEEQLVAIYNVNDFENGKIIDTLYVFEIYRKKGIASKILDKIFNNNFQPIYLWVYKNNDIAINLYKKKGFSIKEETEYRLFMKNENIKPNNEIIKEKIFIDKVESIAREYEIKYKLIIDHNK